ncbi:TnsA endonuclease N-terminal domain-containing protein [Paenibacillus sp. FSL R5-0914]|uniref:TnsA endonuclease N-terminal domain-containing protein n=1 Tax=Paenibacillus sp. FSL R5-0914 TaxID=2921665 RepID=UPI0030FB33D9
MRRQKSIYERYDRMVKLGKGQGYGKKYKPGIQVRDIHSLGLSHQIKGWKTDRVHHLLSNLELYYFYTLEWSLSVSDIREKYLLSPRETIPISERLNIKHPVIIKNKAPAVMHTDFLINVRMDEYNTKLFARSVMPKKTLNTKRTIEKLEIERMFWTERDVDWGIITEEQLDMNVIRNISWFHRAYHLKNAPEVNSELLHDIEPVLYKELKMSTAAFPQAAGIVDQKFNLKVGTSVWIIRHFISKRVWKINMSNKIDYSAPLNITREVNINQIQRCVFQNYVNSQLYN